MLSLVLGNLCIERFRHFVKSDTVVCLQHKLLFQPQLLLKVFQLRHKIYNLVANTLDGFELR